MKPSVYSIFPDFTERFEGKVLHMYLDVRGLVTIGYGCLIDPIELAVQLAFTKPDGGLASPTEIGTEWVAVKGRTSLAKAGAPAAENVTKLRISDVEAYRLLRQRLLNAERTLEGHFPDFQKWPADAQLATLSMAWALGADFPRKGWPKFTAAARAWDFETCAKECKIRETDNPGIVPRNRANFHLFSAACLGMVAVSWND